jgi:two-component system, NtrC family, sensor kinase
MIKFFIFTVSFCITCSVSFGQFLRIEDLESFKRQSNLAKEDTTKVLMMAELTWNYHIWNTDSGLVYGQKALSLAKQIKFPRGEARALIGLAQVSSTQGNLPQALEYGFRALRIAEENQFAAEKAICFTCLGEEFSVLSNSPKMVSYFQQAKTIYESLPDKSGIAFWETLNAFKTAQKLFWASPDDTTLVYMQDFLNANLHSEYWRPPALIRSAGMLFRLGKNKMALDNLREGMEMSRNQRNHYQTCYACTIMAEFYQGTNQSDSCIAYATEALYEARAIRFEEFILENSLTLSQEYESADLNKAFYFRKVYDSANNFLYGQKKVQDLQKIVSDEQQLQRDKEAERAAYQYRLKQYGLLAGLGVFLLVAFLLYRNNRQQSKANQKLQQQKEEIQSTLSQLKSTQKQLIQSEKMASLGELTAGIAHEIQNPLNFVNNFSEVNNELLAEMKDEMNKGNTDDANTIADNVIDNSQKILNHGRRADAIVKSMMQHSRARNSQKEPTDINALVDEYLRLSYHGLRAKDKSFNAKLDTDFDSSIEKIDIIAQDIGRVLLNLYNNAFYAVSEKTKSATIGYEPNVSVCTKKYPDKIEISVTDNGNGIPQNVVDRIFQPFFTTKPTGQGTGLGLSLSYDIIKAHNGEITVTTKEGEFTEFVIQLPV